jgi:hypothetical protein
MLLLLNLNKNKIIESEMSLDAIHHVYTSTGESLSMLNLQLDL